MIDITLLTCQAYYKPDKISPYIQNILFEEQLLKSALEKQGLTVEITYWDNPSYDWSKTKSVIFRTIWDYFEKFEEFFKWLDEIKHQTQLINSYELVKWNIDKHYLKDLNENGINIVPTYFAKQHTEESLLDISNKMEWDDLVIKPAISAAAFQTFKILNNQINEKEELFQQLIKNRDMLVQPFFETVSEFGEASLMIFDGKFSHAILKKAKEGDFRVQDDFGGTVHDYSPSKEEVEFALKVIKACKSAPLYGRVDIVWDQEKNIYLSELEIIEPELWIRNHPKSAESIAEAIKKIL
jgi:glutathione synthase/RimK-type ligase-like ATP-grasp enzyme